MKSRTSCNRRQFLGAGALAAAPFIVPASALGRGSRPAPSERINVAGIGGGRRGRQILAHFLALPNVQVTAICDVNARTAAARKNDVDKHYGNAACAVYRDFRELLAREDADAVFITTPTHWHVRMAIDALRHGNHVYMEKPIGLSIEQGQILRSVVKKHDRVFQVGTQQRSFRDFRFACELVQNGRIGKLRQVEVGVPGNASSPSFPEETVPSWLDYDMWLGAAPLRPFTTKLLDPMYHEMISDYVSAGFMIAWGIHHLDIAQWGSGHDDTGPSEVEGEAVFPESGLRDTPLSWKVSFRYANGVTVSFTDNRKNGQGVRFIGESGEVFVNRGRLTANPETLLKGTIGANEIRLRGHGQQHHSHPRNFIDSIEGTATPNAPIDSAVRADTLCHLAEIAVRLGRKLTWDPVRERFVGDSTADQMLTSYPLREPWRL